MDGQTEYKNFNLFGGRRSAEAIRSTGYNSTGNAIGEIVDNSIQANATEVKIIVEVGRSNKGVRYTQDIRRIGIIDNGDGMDAITLRSALIFGEGTHFEEKNGLGKFGVGLPQASLSQCTILKVWTWQDGIESAIYSGYDIYDDEWRSAGSQVPVPVESEVPELYRNYADLTKKTGTLVLWSNTDRISCTKASTLFDKCEMLVGRMYRKWIHDNKVAIEYCIVDSDTGSLVESKFFRAVDPLFIMDNTIVSDTEPPTDPMFEELMPKKIKIRYLGVEHEVIIRTSYAKPEIAKLVNKKDSAGSTPWGKIAGENIGLSIVREGRELKLDKNWTMTTNNNRDPRHRWWGAEIEFTRDLDEVFGVTNDKQNATALSDAYNDSFKDHRRLKDDGTLENDSEVKERMMVEEPRLSVCIEVAEEIRRMIGNVVNKLPEMKTKGGEPPKPKINEPEEESTKGVKKQQEKGERGLSDDGENKPLEERKEILRQSLINIGAPEAQIEELVGSSVTYEYKFHFIKQSMPGEDSFFSVRTDAGLLLILLNTSHPLYNELFSSFDFMENDKNYSVDELKDMLSDSYSAIKFLLTSWARMEDVALKENKTGASRYRSEWGRQAKIMKGINLDDE